MICGKRRSRLFDFSRTLGKKLSIVSLKDIKTENDICENRRKWTWIEQAEKFIVEENNCKANDAKNETERYREE